MAALLAGAGGAGGRSGPGTVGNGGGGGSTALGAGSFTVGDVDQLGITVGAAGLIGGAGGYSSGGGFSRISNDLSNPDSSINFVVGGGAAGGSAGGAGGLATGVHGGTGGSVNSADGSSSIGGNGSNNQSADGGTGANAAPGDGTGGTGGSGGTGQVSSGPDGNPGQSWADGGLAGMGVGTVGSGRSGGGGSGYGGGGSGGAGGVGAGNQSVGGGGGGASGASRTVGVSDVGWSNLVPLLAKSLNNGRGGVGGTGSNQNGTDGNDGYATLIWLARPVVHATPQTDGAQISWSSVAAPTLPSGFATFSEVEYDVLVDGVVVDSTSQTSATLSGLTPGHTVDVTVLAKSSSTPGDAPTGVPLDVDLETMSSAVAVTPSSPIPPTPPGPSSKAKQTVAANSIPKRIKSRGTTVLNKRNAKTRQGRPLTAKINNVRNRGEVVCMRVVRGKQRKLTVRTYQRCTLTVRVTYSAPGNSKLRPFKQVKTFQVRR